MAQLYCSKYKGKTIVEVVNHVANFPFFPYVLSQDFKVY